MYVIPFDEMYALVDDEQMLAEYLRTLRDDRKFPRVVLDEKEVICLYLDPLPAMVRALREIAARRPPAQQLQVLEACLVLESGALVGRHAQWTIAPSSYERALERLASASAALSSQIREVLGTSAVLIGPEDGQQDVRLALLLAKLGALEASSADGPLPAAGTANGEG